MYMIAYIGIGAGLSQFLCNVLVDTKSKKNSSIQLFVFMAF
jgi:hypothetical protein